MEYFKELWYSNKKETDNYKFLIMLDLEKLSKKDKVIEKYMDEVIRVNEKKE